ncbi:MAG: kelch repeat-containing protein [Polyangiaceae bacterium]
MEPGRVLRSGASVALAAAIAIAACDSSESPVRANSAGASVGRVASALVRESRVWTESPRFSERTGAGSAYDPMSMHVLVFGGYAGDDLDETWLFDVNGSTPSWTLQRTSGPSKRTFPAMATDTARRRVVLFGGRHTSVPNASLDDTWTWFDGTWRLLPTAVHPPGRHCTSLVYDSVRDEFVLFGGTDVARPTPLGDTWVLRGDAWEPRTPAHSPSPRWCASAAFDPRSGGTVVLFGGQVVSGSGASKNTDETWTWDGTDWTLVPMAGNVPVPAPRSVAAMTTGRFGGPVLFGGVGDASSPLTDTWVWSGTRWTNADPPVVPAFQYAQTMAHHPDVDPATDRTYLFGHGDTFAWTGATWANLGADQSPLPRTGARMIFDPAGKESHLFGGAPFGSGNMFPDHWRWTGTSWGRVRPPNSPPARRDHAMAFDSTRKRIVMFGGRVTSGSPAVVTLTDDTWIYDLTMGTWAEVHPAVSPSPRHLHAMAYDPTHDQVVLVGGVRADSVEFAETWIFDGASWSPAASPSSARMGPSLAFDSARGNLVLFGGSASGVTSNTTFTWDGSAWTPVLTAVAPPPRLLASLVDDSDRGRLVLFGGRTSQVNHRDTWTWDGTTWTDTSGAVAPLHPVDGAAAYDAARGRVVYFGGDSRDAASNRTWLLDARGGACTSHDDCVGGRCVDGVCCTKSACGVCATCAGTDPGTCTAIVSAPDPDTCSGASSCDANGECRPARGRACRLGTECASGHCVDGVCCDSACTGRCEACDVPGNVGTCIPVRGAPHGDRPACLGATDESPCTGTVCDGADRTSCGAFVGTDVACRRAACVDGVATLAARCDGKGTCNELPEVPCAPYLCVADGCGVRCDADPDCDARFRCDVATRRCVAKEASTCEPPSSLVSPDGLRVDCAPYRCEGSACLKSCKSVDDCVAGKVCDARSLCVEAPTVDGAGGGCSCGLASGAAPRTAVLALAVLVCLGTSRRARRRVRQRAERS